MCCAGVLLMGVAPRIPGGGKLKLLETYADSGKNPYTYTFDKNLNCRLVVLTLTRDNIIPSINGDVTLGSTILEKLGDISHKDGYSCVHTYAYKCVSAHTGDVLTIPQDSDRFTNITIMFF